MATSRVWRIHPHPRPRESLSSWLIRISAAKGTKHHSLIEQLVPGLQFWTRDGDLIAPPELLEALAERTDTPLACANGTALRAYEGVLDERISGDSQSSMVTPLGVRHRIRKAHGQQFCPECLADPDPYLRLTWRLRLFPVCTRHGSVLRDACPTCDAPYQPHRAGFRRCAACGVDLSSIPRDQADSRMIQLQYHNERVLDGQAVTWPYLAGSHPIAFFGLQLALFRAITSPRWGNRLRMGLVQDLGPLDFDRRGDSNSVRALTSRGAYHAMRAVELLLRGWPFMMVGICGETQSWATWIVPEDRKLQVPFVLRDALDTYLRPGSAHSRICDGGEK